MPNKETTSPNNDKTDQCLQSADQERNISRRTVIRKMAIGSAALAGCSILPEKWTAPVIEFGSLPAHATTSGEIKEVLEEVITDAPDASQQAEDEVVAETSEAPQQAEDEVVAETETEDTAVAGTGKFSLVFYQTVMPCASCGIWFDSAKLVVEHSSGTFTSSQNGGLLIKKGRGAAYFNADLSSIPASATINSATLTMSLNTHEGIANSDNESVIEVYDNPSGSFIRTITARGDIKGSG
ncbi:MAG: hypothetical protein D3910_19410, partial [Candidatus Electrothrix sp. ATG2]|nr:hypothetical protein [Candidatus Electrothrix sp. ATG2]